MLLLSFPVWADSARVPVDYVKEVAGGKFVFVMLAMQGNSLFDPGAPDDVGVIDPDYRGEIVVSLLNTSDQPRTVIRGQRIAQLVFQPIVRAEILPVATLSDTTRGAGGIGHTGKS